VNRWGLAPRLLIALVLLALMASTADAQRRSRRRATATSPGPRYGGHLGYSFDTDDLLVGAQLSLPIATQLDFYPSFDYYFVDGSSSVWAVNFDLKFRPQTRYRLWYLGGGLNLLHGGGGGGTDSHLNLLTGLEDRRGSMRPYIEAKFILGDNTLFQLVGGISWR
jgi:hypothetical protein